MSILLSCAIRVAAYLYLISMSSLSSLLISLMLFFLFFPFFFFIRVRFCFFFSSRRRHTRCGRDWSSDVCSSDLKRYEAEGIAGLFHDRPRGKPFAALPKAQETAVVEKTLQGKPAQATHWSCRSMADAIGISKASVQRSEERRVGKEGRRRWAADE